MKHSTRLKNKYNQGIVRKEYFDAITNMVVSRIKGINISPIKLIDFIVVSPEITSIYLKDNGIMHGLAIVQRKKIKVEYTPIKSFHYDNNGNESSTLDLSNGFWREI